MTDQTQTTTEPVAWLIHMPGFDQPVTQPDFVAMMAKNGHKNTPLYTTPQPLAISLDREAVATIRAALDSKAGIVDLRDFSEELTTILALSAPADGYVLVPVEPELDADMERDLTESDQEAIERGLRTIRAFDAVRDLRSVLSDTMTRQHSGYDWNADSDGMTLRQSEAIKQADRALPAAPTGGRS